MKNNQPKYNGKEEINLDKRNTDLTNTDIENSILRLMQISKPLYDEYGIKIEPSTRFIWICNLASYITEEVLLNRVIDFFTSNFEKEDFKHTDNYLKSIKELFSSDDFTKVKAIYYSIIAKYMATKENFSSQNSHVPTFKIHLIERIISHNFPLVEKFLLRNFEIEYKENLKKIPAGIALEIHNRRMESLRDLDFLYDTKISLDIREYHIDTQKMLVDKIELALRTNPQQASNQKKPTKQETLLTNPLEAIFRNDFAFTLFMKMKEIYSDEPKTQQANYSFLFDIMSP
ncbi:hypothetical protein KW795_02645, partial [Candidatus Microgenomates bacterium]|nr:hypothetical protein [Candidatus Microgenomates bacterium]